LLWHAVDIFPIQPSGTILFASLTGLTIFFLRRIYSLRFTHTRAHARYWKLESTKVPGVAYSMKHTAVVSIVDVYMN
jgi:hypothetical protein